MKRIFTRLFLLLIVFTLGTVPTSKASNSVRQSGKNFWLTLGGNSSGRAYVMMISQYHASVIFKYTTTGATRNYNVQPGEVLQVELTTAELNAIDVIHPAGAISNKSLNIQSDSNITVYFSTAMHTSEDGMLIYPTDKQEFGDTYYLIGTPLVGTKGGFGTNMFAIVATCDSTVLEVTPSQIIAGNFQNPIRYPGVPYTIVLNKGQTYQFGAHTNGTHLTGTKLQIKSARCCNPLNVFLTYPPTNMAWAPYGGFGGCCADELLEQILPINVWDTLFPVVRFQNNKYNKINIVSATDNNVVSIDGTPFKTLMAGQFCDTMIEKPVIIRSLYPCAVSEYMTGQFSNLPPTPIPTGSLPADSLTDPDALLCLSFKDGLRETYFITNGQSYITNNNLKIIYNRFFLLTIISHANNINTVTLNGIPQASKFLPFASDPDIMYAQIKVDTGVVYHLVSQERVIAYYNAAAKDGSVSYNLGDIIDSVGEEQKIMITDTADMCVNDTIILAAGEEGRYTWSTGENTNDIRVSNAGTYDVLIQSERNCNDIRKSFTIRENNYSKSEDLTDTVYKCAGEIVALTTDSSATTYLWNNGITTNEIITDAFGQYDVLLTWQALCSQANHYFDVIQSPYIATDYRQPDTTICSGDTLILYGKDATTLWSTGAKGASILVNASGTYWHEWIDSCSSMPYRDTVIVSDNNCLFRYCNIAYPDAFTPNGDGKNDIFRAVRYGQMQQRQLIIYNRLGQRVFQSNNINQGWDGMYNGQQAPLGTYMYYAEVDCLSKGLQTFKGDITLIR